MWTRFNGLTFISYQGRFYREAIYLGEKSRKADPSWNVYYMPNYYKRVRYGIIK